MRPARPATPSNQTARFEADVREWAVRTASLEMKDGDPAEVMASVAAKVGCTAATLRRWMRQAERAGGIRPGVFTNPKKRVSELEAQVAALKAHNARLALEKHRGAWGSLIIGAPLTAEAAATPRSAGSDPVNPRAVSQHPAMQGAAAHEIACHEPANEARAGHGAQRAAAREPLAASA